MTFMIPDMNPAMAEIALGAGICVVLLADLFISDRWRDLTYLLAMATLAVTAWIAGSIGVDSREITFNGSFIADPLARILKLFALAAVATVFLYSRDYLKQRQVYKGEYYLLGLFALLGIQVMISAYSMLTMYLGLEILSLSLYSLVAFERDNPVAAEAAIKYFVLGAIASGCLLYGISLIYGVTGTLQFAEISEALLQSGPNEVVALVGLAFIIVGIAFKFGAVPFHMWLPDVYHGAPTCMTLFIGTAPKLAAFALAIRVLAEGLGPLAPGWEGMLAVLAVLSLGIGNVVAIVQTNIKRMLAYSTIGHVGFIFLGLLTGSQAGFEAALFYTIVYVLMAAGAFGMVMLLSRKGFEAERLDDFKGLNRRSPWFALIMLLIMVSMIGVPPLAGFYAKWWVLAALIADGHVGLAVTAVVFSVIGAFYYLRVVKLMYFDEPEETEFMDTPFDFRLVLSINGLLILALGIFPDRLIAICTSAFA
ncbi:MAG: NADH-quinone oxidoreductase subunit NuoN [Gammaproteobacteria bacterium]|nr:NADH-quinone oxidoreductase subunit NuoN [Gammaproteobacteria bacterium]